MVSLTYFGFGLVLYRLRFKPFAAVIVLLSPFVFHNAVDNNIDWLVSLGIVMPPQWGIFLLLGKPQMGIGIVIMWLIHAWRQGKTKEVIKLIGPVGIISLLSFIPFGFWPMRIIQERLNDFS